MVHVCRVIAVIALLCPVALAGPCVASSCAVDDETAFVQLKKVVTHGGERQPKEMLEEIGAEATKSTVHQPLGAEAMKALVESLSGIPDHVDAGAVTSAYEANVAKGMDGIVSDVDSAIRFHHNVEKGRREDREQTAERLRKIDRAVERTIHAKQEEVHAAVSKKRAVVEAAVEHVAKAKQQWEEHHIKKEQAENYAIQGRMEGARMGVDQAHRLVDEAKEDAVEAARKERRDAEKAAERMRVSDRRAAIQRELATDSAVDGAFVDRAADAASAAEAHVKAYADQAKEDIEGAEGMKERLIKQSADRAADVYNTKTEEAQERINDADTARWPEGDWPTPWAEHMEPPQGDQGAPGSVDVFEKGSKRFHEQA